MRRAASLLVHWTPTYNNHGKNSWQTTSLKQKPLSQQNVNSAITQLLQTIGFTVAIAVVLKAAPTARAGVAAN
jgi:hypothetical protein